MYSKCTDQLCTYKYIKIYIYIDRYCVFEKIFQPKPTTKKQNKKHKKTSFIQTSLKKNINLFPKTTANDQNEQNDQNLPLQLLRSRFRRLTGERPRGSGPPRAEMPRSPRSEAPFGQTWDSHVDGSMYPGTQCTYGCFQK